MKKLIFTAVLFLLLITACGTQTSATGQTAAEALPAATELMLGTFKLEGTSEAVTADQAARILPLWQVYQSLTGSDTAAQEEIDALVAQIQGTMTSSQMEAIQAMHLTQADVKTVLVENSIMETAPQQSSSSTSSSTAPQGGPEGGLLPADMTMDDPGMTGGMQPVSSTTSSNPSAMSSTAAPSVLVSALIQLLESRVG